VRILLVMDRRDLLKLFGIGSVIAPVIGGVASAAPLVKLIQEPKYELVPPQAPVEATELPASGDSGDFEITAYFRDKRSRSVHRIECSAFLLSYRCEVIDVTTPGAAFRSYFPGPAEMTLRVTGAIHTGNFIHPLIHRVARP
jgi:hypothetical protein